MSPFMALLFFILLTGVVVCVIGLVGRKRRLTYIGTPAVLLLVLWIFAASIPPNPEKEFDRIFGAGHWSAASEIKTIKPTVMDGHLVSFRMRPVDFETYIRPHFSERLESSSILLGHSLPTGWPAAIETTTSVLYREVENEDVYLLYIPSEGMAYASIWYEQW